MKVFILITAMAVALAYECGENQRLQGCPTTCPITCENRMNPPRACPFICLPDGCVCNDGYIKVSEDSNECVRPENCPSGNICDLPPETGRCRAFFERYHYDNESGQCKKFVYGGCGGNKNNFQTMAECQHTCGYKDPEECGENQHYESCGTPCPLTCENRFDPPKPCVLRCDPGCHCDEGYVKTKDGRCVTSDQCPEP